VTPASVTLDGEPTLEHYAALVAAAYEGCECVDADLCLSCRVRRNLNEAMELAEELS
jgi:bacterioferritin (cytochrome b1)